METIKVKIIRPCVVHTELQPKAIEAKIGEVFEVPRVDGKYLVALGKATEDLKWEPVKKEKPEAKK